MRRLIRFFGLGAVCGLVLTCLCHAEEWVHGSVYLPELPAGVDVVHSGGAMVEPATCPLYLPGHVSLSDPGRSQSILTSSSGLRLAFDGPGEFWFERLEDAIESGVVVRSRVIVGVREGDLLIDARKVSADSQISLELPMGRLDVGQAFFSVQVSYDERSEIYDFRIVCAEGSVRFTDREGRHYFSNASQLLTGVGTYYAPTLEISDINKRIRERFVLFEERAQELLEPAESAAAFAAVSEPIEEAEFDAVAESIGRDPVVIEYVPRTRALIPDRGRTPLLGLGAARQLLGLEDVVVAPEVE